MSERRRITFGGREKARQRAIEEVASQQDILLQMRQIGDGCTNQQQCAIIEEALRVGRMHESDRAVFSRWLDELRRNQSMTKTQQQLRLILVTTSQRWDGSERLTNSGAHLPPWMRDAELLPKKPPGHRS